MHTPSNRISPCGELMPPGLFGSTTIDCSASMEKANTRGATGATGVVVALESASKMLPKSLMTEHWAAVSVAACHERPFGDVRSMSGLPPASGPPHVITVGLRSAGSGHLTAGH